MTPNSSLILYAQPSDLFARTDINSISQYCTDQGSNPEGAIQSGNTWVVQEALLALSPKVLTALATASGELESSVLRSEFYQVADLQSLTGNSQQYMINIVCGLAMYHIVARRPGPNPPEAVINNYNAAMKALEDLSNGVKIFAFAQTEQAGLPLTVPLQNYDFINAGLISSQYNRVFGLRSQVRRGFWGR